MPLTGDANASQEKVDKLAGPLLEEYLHIKVIDFLSDPCAHGVRSLGSNVFLSVQHVFDLVKALVNDPS